MSDADVRSHLPADHDKDKKVFPQKKQTLGHDTHLCGHMKAWRRARILAIRTKQPLIKKKWTLISAAFNHSKTRSPSATFRPCSKLISNNAIMWTDDLIWEWFSFSSRDWFDYGLEKMTYFTADLTVIEGRWCMVGECLVKYFIAHFIMTKLLKMNQWTWK